MSTAIVDPTIPAPVENLAPAPVEGSIAAPAPLPQEAQAVQEAVPANEQAPAVTAPVQESAPVNAQADTSTATPLADVYIAQLLQPFRSGLEQPGMTVPSINSWLETSGILNPQQVAAVRNNYAAGYRAAKGGDATTDVFADPDPNLVKPMVDIIAQVLYAQLKQASPWGVLRQAQQMPQLFGIPSGTTTLPIKVTSGPNVYYHQMTEDQVLGILLYPAELSVQMSLYDYPITRDFLSNMPTSYQEGYVLLTVGEQNYLGHDAGILSGYLTGADWAGKSKNDILPSVHIKLVQNGQLVPVRMA